MKLIPCSIFIFALTFPLSAFSSTGSRLDVAFIAEKYRMNLEVNGTLRETDFDSLQIHWYESLLSHLDGGIRLGYIDSTQPDNPIVEGQNTSGQFLELGLRGYFYRGDILTLSSALTYRYSQTEQSQNSQQVEWRWYTWQLNLDARFRATDYLEFQAGINAISIDGTEQATGTVSQTLDFNEEDSLSAYGAAYLLLDRNGRIGIRIDTGSLRGGQIYFSRWF